MKSIELSTPAGLSCTVSSLGAALHRLFVPDRDDRTSNVVLGYESQDDYASDPFFIGATVGRVANRIAQGEFDLDGHHYKLEQNNAPHHLHGGSEGWYRRKWETTALTTEAGAAALFSLRSPDGDAGYPGEVLARVSYLLREKELHIVMTATSDALTLINLAHHSYFNLAGAGDILQHELTIESDEITPGAPVPTGLRHQVQGTPFDFTNPSVVGAELPTTPGCPPGFDHNYLLRTHVPASPSFHKTSSEDEGLLCRGVRAAATLIEPGTGRCMELLTNQPGLQLYTGNYLDGRAGLGRNLTQYAGICLETQAVPNFINLPEFSTQGILAPGQTYRHEMLLRFSTIPA